MTLKKTYDFQGRTRRVNSRVAVSPVTSPVRDPSLVVPRGRRPFRVTVRVQDEGASPFPFAWARFTVVGRGGARSTGSSMTPMRRLEPGRKESPRTAIITFLVPKGFVPARVRMTSIVDVWPFTARWAVEPAGP